MAPEQRAGQPPDARADQYALCVALAESIDGRRPPVEVEHRDLSVAHASLIAFIVERRPHEPELDQLCGVLARGLAKDPKRRFPDTGMLADALEKIVAPRELETPSSNDGRGRAAGDHVVPAAEVVRLPSSQQSRSTPPTRVQPRRRAGSLVVAGLAAAAGVTAVLFAARFATKKSTADDAVAIAGSGSGSSPTPGSSAPPTVETIDPGETTTPERPTGVPLDTPPRPPPTKTVAAATTAYADLSSYVTDMQRALKRRDVRGCRGLTAALPKNIHPSAMFSVEQFASMCEMMAGDCAGGMARLQRAHAAQDVVFLPAMYADQYCPIEGTLDARLSRLRDQTSGHTLDHDMHLAWCDALIPHAKKAASEVKTGPQQGTAGYVLQRLAKCVSLVGRCDDARALWSLSLVDPSQKWRTPELSSKCAAAAADLAKTEIYAADVNVLVQDMTKALLRRDARKCISLAKSAPPNAHPTFKHMIEMFHGMCEMQSGDCAGGTARLTRVGPNPGGAFDPATHAGWLKSNVSMYCPVAGDLDTRLERLKAKVDAFGGGDVGFCDSILGAAKTAAGEAQTGPQRKAAAFTLKRLATCVGTAGRCDQGADLWALAVQADPSTPSTPKLGPKCP